MGDYEKGPDPPSPGTSGLALPASPIAPTRVQVGAKR